MNSFIKIGRAFYGIGIFVYGLQQIVTKDFHPVVIPEFPVWVHQYAVFPYITGIALMICGPLIAGVFKINAITAKKICLYTGFYFLALIIICHFPYRFLISPHKVKHLGLWTEALKELALSGGAFVMAGSFFDATVSTGKNNFFENLLEKLIPFGKIFFSVTMISFGVDHFYYTEHVSTMVPAWFGIPAFWTRFAGIALIGSGLAIILNIWTRPVGFLLAAMVFGWFVFLHIPRAVVYPPLFNRNEIASAFDALISSGIALVIAHTKGQINKIDSMGIFFTQRRKGAKALS